jgi:hypothetical protein
MAFQRVPNTMQVDVLYLLFGQRVENVFYIQAVDGIDAVVLADTADMMINWVSTQLMPALSVDLTFIGVEVRNLDIEAGSIIARTPAVPVNGGTAVSSEPGNVSFCVSLRSLSAGRSFRGRKYIPGMPITQRVGNTVQPGWVTDLLDAFNNLITVLNAADRLLVVVSRIAAGVARIEALATPVVSVTNTDFFIDSQRRRLTGRGT